MNMGTQRPRAEARSRREYATLRSGRLALSEGTVQGDEDVDGVNKQGHGNTPNGLHAGHEKTSSRRGHGLLSEAKFRMASLGVGVVG